MHSLIVHVQGHKLNHTDHTQTACNSFKCYSFKIILQSSIINFSRTFYGGQTFYIVDFSSICKNAKFLFR